MLQQHAASVQPDTTSDVSKLEMKNSKHNNFIGLLLGFYMEFSNGNQCCWGLVGKHESTNYR